MKLELTAVEVRLIGIAMGSMCNEGTDDELLQKHCEELTARLAYFIGAMMEHKTKMAMLEETV